MQADSLSQVADGLYGLLPADFTAARDEHARQAKAAGQRQEAAEIKKLTRPTASAWLVNQLVRGAVLQMDRLFEIGLALHAAQRELAGDRLRDLSGQRRDLLAELIPEAARLAAAAGQPAGAAVLAEVRATLEAALADPAAGQAVRSGRLTRSLTYAGLGEVDLTAALAVLPGESPAGSDGPRRGRPAAPQRSADRGLEAGDGEAKGAGRPRQTRQERAAEELRTAEAAMASATAAADEAESRVTNVAEQRQFLRRRMEHLRRELGSAEAEDSGLAREAKQATRDHDAAVRALAAVQRRLDQARERAGPG